MTRPAKRLVVVRPPEQLQVAAVRHNVVYHVGLGHSSLALALGAQRMPRQKQQPVALPASAIAALSGRLTPAIADR